MHDCSSHKYIYYKRETLAGKDVPEQVFSTFYNAKCTALRASATDPAHSAEMNRWCTRLTLHKISVSMTLLKLS